MQILLLCVLAVLSNPCCATSSLESRLQNDFLAAMSWALLEIDPYEAVLGRHFNSTNSTEQQPFVDGQDEGYTTRPSYPELNDTSMGRSLVDPESLDSPDPTSSKPMLRSLFFSFQGRRPRLRFEIRLLKWTLFELYDRTNVIFFLGTQVNGFLEDILRLKDRGLERNSFLSSLEDIVSLIGVDGPACVHRMMCELGAAPALKSSGLFGELVDITVRHVLMESYAPFPNDIPLDTISRKFSEDAPFDGEDSAVSYLDAVAAGRTGADCAATFPQCPMSLLSMLKFVQDFNS
ncbi:uncharacterized protein LOC108666674 [Hyalella azteca]|uniref:Uncharacterized protein LOC108666674 n=1 Tax=Hyalella azteca TaxID=294128 RepID=A0A8B7N5D2_HYAAZ|nr:uncharacterized protein LOC108666674 [Hyalella azteca]